MSELHEPMTIENLADGDMLEQLQGEIDRVIGNCLDPGTNMKKRTVTLKVELVPNDDRTEIDTVFSVSSKIQSAPEGGDVIRLQGGVMVVSKKQQTLPFVG